MGCLKLVENEYLTLIKKDFASLFRLPEDIPVNFKRLDFRFTSSGRSLERIQISVPAKSIKKNYIIKSTAAIYPEWEVEWSESASRFNLGPRVIYGDEKKEVIIEEDLLIENNLRNRVNMLNSSDIRNLSIRIAEKFFLMLSKDVDAYYHKFDKFVEHTFIVGEGESIDVKWVDWGKAGKINKNTKVCERQTVAEFHLRRIFEMYLCWFKSPEGLARFILHLRKIAGKKFIPK